MFASNSSQVSSDAVFIEDVFSTYLYTGNGSTQTITNGIDFSGKGGLLWIKNRTNLASHAIVDTARGSSNWMQTNTTNGEASNANIVTGFNSNGFGLGNQAFFANSNGDAYVSWSFRKQAKFVDIVTYTGNGVSGRQISHNLGSTPGFIIIKPASQPGGWVVAHRGNGTTAQVGGYLDTTGQLYPDTNQSLYFNSTYFVPTNLDGSYNTNGTTYVAYLFAHNAGGFGTAGTDNVISCGSYTGNASTAGPIINLGYEPQFVMVKAASTTGNWTILDNMRALSETGYAYLRANTTAAEVTGSTALFRPLPTGFQPLSASDGDTNNPSGTTYIYIAIRRGPMKTPTSGTSVFAPVTRTAPSTTVTSNTNPDLLVAVNRNTAGYEKAWLDKLRGKIGYIASSSAGSEYSGATATLTNWGNTGVVYNSSAGAPANDSGVTYVDYYFTRAPGFMDEVCYTGTGVNRTVTHNLGVAPELMIVKDRTNATYDWFVYASGLTSPAYILRLNTTLAQASTPTVWNSTAPTSTAFSVGTAAGVNASGDNYVAYLFASCPGVSKVGSYTGTGTTLQINCGFTGGARFVMIKRTDSTGGWYVWDTARGIIGGNDPFSFLNTTAAETTNTDYIDAYSAGFEISSTAPAAINASGGTFIYMAIS